MKEVQYNRVNLACFNCMKLIEWFQEITDACEVL